MTGNFPFSKTVVLKLFLLWKGISSISWSFSRETGKEFRKNVPIVLQNLNKFWKINLNERDTLKMYFSSVLLLNDFSEFSAGFFLNNLVSSEAVAQRCSAREPRRLWHRCFAVNFCKSFKNTFFYRAPTVAASVSSDVNNQTILTMTLIHKSVFINSFLSCLILDYLNLYDFTILYYSLKVQSCKWKKH